MERSSLELDFFGMERKDPNGVSLAAKPSVFKRRRSFRDIQGVITKMNPELVKSVIANGAYRSTSVSVPSTPKDVRTVCSPLPLYDPKLSLHSRCENSAPLTIFYNGTVAVFNVSPVQAKDILKVTVDILPPNKFAQYSESHSLKETDLLESLNEDLPISRKNSLQRFLEKRKERFSPLVTEK